MPLFVVATPIGNLEDVTMRAVRTLEEADLVAAEDTRTTRKLFARYGIRTPMTSYHEHNERSKAAELVDKLKKGENIALVTDAGTPGISDPGYRLVRLATENDVEVVPVPGPSAVAAVLSVAGVPTDEFTFKGFVPQGAKKRRDFLLSLRGGEHTFVLYESPRRLRATLTDVAELLEGAEVVVAREVTKLHEEFLRGSAGDIIEGLGAKEVKGEVTLVVRTRAVEADHVEIRAEIAELLEKGFQVKEVAKTIAREHGLKKSDIYGEALEISKHMERKRD